MACEQAEHSRKWPEMAESFSFERSVFERWPAAQTKERLPPSILQIGTMPYKDRLKE
jgi:hypothetical protein